jgi:DNA-binding MarR family transcriptional regulator
MYKLFSDTSGEQLCEFLITTERIWKTSTEGFRNVFTDCPPCHFELLFKICLSMNKLEKNGSVNVSDLAREMHVLPSALSRDLRTLENEKLVERYADPEDRRRMIVRLTDFGSSVFEEYETALLSYLRCVLERFGEENFRRLLALQKDLLFSFEEENNVQKEGRA